MVTHSTKATVHPPVWQASGNHTEEPHVDNLPYIDYKADPSSHTGLKQWYPISPQNRCWQLGLGLCFRWDLHDRGMDYAEIRFVLCVNRILRLWELVDKDLLAIDWYVANRLSRAGRGSFPKHSPNWWYISNTLMYTTYHISNTKLNYRKKRRGRVKLLSMIHGK